jgi:hypothetical protein
MKCAREKKRKRERERERLKTYWKEIAPIFM